MTGPTNSLNGGSAVRLLALGGSARPASSSERALRVVAAAATANGAAIQFITARDLLMPLYQPGGEQRSHEARGLIEAVRQADGLFISAPGYHGALSGMVKNALDYLEDLRGDPRVYLDGLPVGCIAVASGWQAAVSTLHNLRTVVHALRGWPSPLGAALNSSEPIFDSSGSCLDISVRDQLTVIAGQVVEFARARAALHRETSERAGVHP